MILRLGALRLRVAVAFLTATAAVLSLRAQTDDHGNTAATATAITLNATTAGVISSETDIDYFRIVLAQNAKVTAFTTGALDTVGSLRNSADADIFTNDDNGTDTNFRTISESKWISPRERITFA
jgi:hypothetical protein